MNPGKAELALLIAIKKATSIEETCPKQKHVRTCIMHLWDNKSSQVFWAALKNSSFLSHEIQCFKALITIHKVIRGGHPATLPEAIIEKKWIQNVPRMLVADQIGYTSLIREYCEYLSFKLEFHRLHPDFNATFDYEEYISMKELTNVDEGYETISELMGLLDRLDRFQQFIFASLRKGSNLECRLSALVPLIEESYGIYRFITSMLRAIHLRVGSIEALEPLRQEFIKHHAMLKEFYKNSRNYRYLTSLVSIPELPDSPPSFYDSEAIPKLPSRPLTPSEADDDTETMFPKENSSTLISLSSPSNSLLALNSQPQLQPQPQPQLQLQQQEYFQMLIQQQQSQLNEHTNLQAQLQHLLKDRELLINQLQDQLLQSKTQNDQSKLALQQYDLKLAELQKLQAQSQSHVDSLLTPLRNEVEEWKKKYEALAKLYAQLRKEHLDLLQSYKDLQLQMKSNVQSQDQLSKLQSQLNSKNLQIADMIRERDELQQKVGLKVVDESKLDQLQSQLLTLQKEYQAYKKDKEEEVLILQTSVDQSLEALAKLKLQVDQDRGVQVASLEKNYAAQLDKLFDATLFACIQKIQLAGQEFESPLHQGHVHATPESTLTVLETAVQAAGVFAQNVLAFLNGSGDQAETIISANHLAYTFIGLLNDCSGLTRLIPEFNPDSQAQSKLDDFLMKGQKTVTSMIHYYLCLTSKELGNILVHQRTSHVSQKFQLMLAELHCLAEFIDTLVVQKGTKVEVGDMEQLVEKEMQLARLTIQEATQKLQALLATPLSPANITVHTAILSAAMALMQAIGNLIRYATLTQQEIIEHGKGSMGSATSFYKKNHRWTEGLISAAKAIASATVILVETADGMVENTHSMEQVVVAANEVAGATAQLVAASRVKAIEGSKLQPKLETAASDVSQATKLLVKAAKEAALKANEQQVLSDFQNLSLHDLKKEEMEQQVKILTLEKDLVTARNVLAQLRKASYHTKT